MKDVGASTLSLSHTRALAKALTRISKLSSHAIYLKLCDHHHDNHRAWYTNADAPLFIFMSYWTCEIHVLKITSSKRLFPKIAPTVAKASQSGCKYTNYFRNTRFFLIFSWRQNQCKISECHCLLFSGHWLDWFSLNLNSHSHFLASCVVCSAFSEGGIDKQMPLLQIFI